MQLATDELKATERFYCGKLNTLTSYTSMIKKKLLRKRSHLAF